MSEENVELLRTFYGPEFRAWDKATIERFYEELWDPDIDWRAIEGAPDDVGVMEGRDALRAYYADWQEMFDGITVEAEEILDAGDDTVVVVSRVAATARLSGIPTGLQLSIVYTLRDRRVARGREYATRDEALAAAGLDG